MVIARKCVNHSFGRKVVRNTQRGSFQCLFRQLQFWSKRPTTTASRLVRYVTQISSVAIRGVDVNLPVPMFGLQYSLAARCLPSGIRSVEAGVVRLSGEIPLLTRLTARDLTCNMPDSRMGVIYASPDSGIRAASTASHRLPNELLANLATEDTMYRIMP